MAEKKVFISGNRINLMANLMAVPFLRRAGLSLLDKIVKQKMRLENANKIPPLMVTDKGHMLHNLVKVTDTWLSSKYVTKDHLPVSKLTRLL